MNDNKIARINIENNLYYFKNLLHKYYFVCIITLNRKFMREEIIMKNNKVLMILGVLAMLVIMGGCSKGDEKEKLVLGTSADYPPYEFHLVENGEDKIVGFDIDIAKEIAKDLGKELEIKDMDFGGLIAALKSGSVDFVISGMTATEERAKEIDFSNVYYSADQGIILKNELKDKVKSVDDLKTLKVGAQRGTLQEEIVKSVTPEDQYVGLAKLGDLVMKLKADELDAIVVELDVAKAYAKKHEDLAVVDPKYVAEDNGVAVAIKKGNEEFVKQINESLKRIESEGLMEEFLLKSLEQSEIEE